MPEQPHDTDRAGPRRPAAPFHGDAVVRAAFLSGVLGWGLGFYGPPIFLYALTSSMHWSNALVSAAITLHFLFGAIVVSWLPRIHARHGVPRTTLAGACALAIGVVGWAAAHAHWQLFAAALFTGAGWVTMSAAGINAMVSPWFDRRRPMALSKAYNGASVGGMVFSPLWSVLIAQFGFLAAAVIISTGMLGIMFWLTRRVLRFTPAMLGQLPDGDAGPGMSSAPAPGRPVAANATWQPLPGRSLWSNRRFVTLAAAMTLSLAAQSGLLSHLYASLLAPQLGARGAGWGMTLVAACAMLGRMLYAKALSTVRERRLLACASYGMQVVGSLLLMTSEAPGLQLWCGLILFGAGIGNTISLPPLIAQADFAASDVARVVALIVAISQGLYAFAPLGFSLLLAIGPGHAWLFAGAMALQILAVLMLWAGRARQR